MNLLVIQARMGSTRLPGKVLKPIAGIPLLEWMLNRLEKAKLVDERIIAITTNPEDDELEKYCLQKGEKVFRGSDWDVLDRFYGASSQFEGVDYVIRICSDNPLHSYKVVDFAIDQCISRKVDYFSNSNHEPDFLEDGFDTEVFTFKALEVAWKEAKRTSEREHVTPYIKNCGKFKCAWQKANKNYQFKLSVDTENDRLAVEKIFEELANKEDFGIDEVVSLLQHNPEILSINKESEINSGYKKSLKEDKYIS